MNKALLSCFAIVTVACASVPDRSGGADGILVDADWLAEHLDDPSVCVLEIGRSRDDYLGGHIPNARFVDWLDIADKDEPDRFNLPREDQLASLLGGLGISNTTTVVFYDDMSSRLATRMYWTMNYYGHADMRILDGGKQSWKGSGRDLTRETRDVEATTYEIREGRAETKADMELVKAGIGEDSVVIVDGRPTEQYKGAAPGKAFHTGKEHKRRGHVPGAVNIPWKSNFNEDGTFKSATELRALYASFAVTEDSTVITYCNEGLHAAPPWFVLTTLLGYRTVPLYDDSMAEWANRDDTPMETDL